MRLAFQQYHAAVGEGATVAETAALIGRVVCGTRLRMLDYATLRGDGEHIRTGDDAFFAERATVHINHARLGTTIGDRATVGRYALVHACVLGDGVVVGEGASVMDGATVADGAVIAADSIVSPGKKLPGGSLYAGVPAQPVREIGTDEALALAASIRSGIPGVLVRSPGLSALAAPADSGSPRAASGLRAATSYVAPTARVRGEVELHEDSGVYFGCVVDAGDGRIVIGERSNVQDNSFLITYRSRGELIVGRGVTIGHNVQMGSCRVGDGVLIGMMSRLADDVIVEEGAAVAGGAWVERGAVVKSGWIWAGRPARAFREVRDAERIEFARAADTYVAYGAVYRGDARALRAEAAG